MILVNAVQRATASSGKSRDGGRNGAKSSAFGVDMADGIGDRNAYHATMDLVSRYDHIIFDAQMRALYEGTDFFNVGDWGSHPAGPPEGLAQAAHRLVERHLAADPPRTASAARVILDVGCGLGSTTGMVARHYPSALVLGINLSARQTACAAAAQPAARFAVMDAARLAIGSNLVDCIHSIEAAFHFTSRLDFLREAHRVLRPGGKLIMTDILFRRPFPGVPVENLWRDEAEYRARCTTTGLGIESVLDITTCTAAPFCRHLRANGMSGLARLLRRAIAAYYFVILHRPAG
jgi:MPBQ/MSBQ methyltransferase